jgi:hypothetical protein
MKYGFVRETEKIAKQAGPDKITGIPRTGLDTYLQAIFPDTNDWIHDKCFPGQRIRPDYRSETLRLIIEFDGLLHFTTKAAVDKDTKNTKIYVDAGYKVVRISFYLNLTTKVINKLFDLQLTDTFFEGEVCPFTEVLPCDFCLSGLNRMFKDLSEIAPEQLNLVLKCIENKCPLEYAYIKQLKQK